MGAEIRRSLGRHALGTPRWVIAFASLALWVVTLATFSPALEADFIDYDDDVYVLDNPIVAQGLDADSLGLAFRATRSGNWHPVTWLSHALDVQFFGFHPEGHHATSVLLHSLNTLLLLWLLAAATGRFWPSLLVAALFALHPLRAESVTWVAERKDVLSGFLGLATLLAYMSWARRGKRALYGLALLLFALGCMAKSMLVTWPVLLLLFDLWPLRRRVRWLEKLPFAAVSVATMVLAVLTQHGEGATAGLRVIPFGARLQNAFAAGATYVGELLLPRDLAVFYPHPAVFGSVPLVPTIAGALLLLGALLVGLRTRRSLPFLGVGFAWFFVTLLPVIGIVQVGMQGHADRYTYLPSIGLLFAGAFLLDALVARSPRLRVPVTGACALAIPLLGVATQRQVRLWHDTRTLFEHTNAVTRNNWVALRALGNLYARENEHERAIATLEEELRLGIDRGAVEARLGQLFFEGGDSEQAARHFEAALGLTPEDAVLELDLANVYLGRDSIDAAREMLERAKRHGAQAGRLAYTQGLVASAVGDPAGARISYLEAVEVDPESGDAWNNLGQACLALGRVEEAVGAYERLTRLEPENPGPHFNLGVALERADRPESAAEAYRKALQLGGDATPARARLEALGAEGGSR